MFDIIIEGVSITGNYRAQFKQLLRGGKSGIEDMLEKLEKKVNTEEAAPEEATPKK